MNQFLWDASAWDWPRGPMDLVTAKKEGIVGFSHRGTIGTIYKDPYLGNGITRALDSGIEVLGAYMVPRTPGNNGNKPLGEQVDFFLAYLNQQVPWWHSWPYWFFQVDSEKWGADSVSISLGFEACQLLSRITKKRVIHYAPKWAYGNTIPGKEPLWASHYVAESGNFKTIYPGDSFAGWSPYSNRTPVFLQYSDKATIAQQSPCDANAFRGTLAELKKFIGGDGPTVTYAPDDLKIVQEYTKTKTGQSYASLGIVAGQVQGGYHAGVDMLRLLGTAPEQPGGDYSYTESQRDRNGLSDAASAFDLGGNFSRFREITMGIVNACKNGDPRTRDIREVIYTPDGTTVKRWDRLGIRSSGDDSHLSHTHVSFFRDSDGYRDDDNNFLGLLKELFDGKPIPPPNPVPLEDDVPTAYLIEMPVKVGDMIEVGIPPKNTGGFGWGQAWMHIVTDPAQGAVSYRIALGDGTPTGWSPAGNARGNWGWVDLTPTINKWEMGDAIPNGTVALSITRVNSGVTVDDAKDRHVAMCVQYGPRS